MKWWQAWLAVGAFGYAASRGGPFAFWLWVAAVAVLFFFYRPRIDIGGKGGL